MKYLFRFFGTIIFSIIIIIIAWKVVDSLLGGVPSSIVSGTWRYIKEGSAILGINPVWSALFLLLILGALGSKKSD